MSANSVFQDFAQENGYQYDTETGMLHGRVGGHHFSVLREPNYNRFYATFSAAQNGVPVTIDAAKAFCKGSKLLFDPSVNGNGVTFHVMGSTTLKGSFTKLSAGLTEAAGFLTSGGYADCCERCSEVMDVKPCIINDGAHLLCQSCFAGVAGSLEDNKQAAARKKGSLVTGLVGALLGSLLGVAAIVIISRLGYVAAISGVIMGVCTLKGYELLGGKANKLGILLCCLLMVGMVWVGDTLDWAFVIMESYETSMLDSYRMVPMLLEIGDIEAGSYWMNLIQLFAFTALGAFPTIRSFYREKSGKYKVKQVA